MTDFKKAEITRINSNGDRPWLVSSGAIEARFRDHANAIHFAHAHATMRAGHRRTNRAEYPAHKRRWQELIDAINGTSRTQP